MHHHGIVSANPVEKMQGLAALHHIVLGQDLEPVDGRRLVENCFVMGGSQSQAKAKAAAISG